MTTSPVSPGRDVQAQQPGPRLTPVVASCALLCSAVLASGTTLPLLRLVAALALLFGLPTALVFWKIHWPSATKTPEALFVSFGLNLLAVILAGLALNQTLPLVGLQHPLARWPVLLATDVGLAGLLLWRRSLVRRLLPIRCTLAGAGLPRRDAVLLGAVLVLVLGAVVGAVRLNNGAGGGATTVMLGLAALVLIAAFAWSDRLRPVTTLGTIYLLSLALLLMTSLRGWYITGHDIQREFRVFELTAAQQRWNVGVLRSAYNACLSITVLPTTIAELSGLGHPWVFKVVFQLIFALCPVMVYLIAQRFVPPRLALVSVTYFVSFPTYFTDMPFLCRQEIAFVFLGLLLLVATTEGWGTRRRQAWCLAFGAGVALAHYSTNYVLIAVLVGGWLMGLGLRAVSALRRRPAAGPPRGAARRPAVLGAATFLPIAVLTALWTGPATHTGGQIEATASSTFGALTGRSADSVRSSDTSYSLWGGPQQSPEQRLASYREETLQETVSERGQGLYYPLSEVDRYPTPVVPQPDLPLTRLGGALERLGLDVPLVNKLLHQGGAGILQVFILVGLLTALLGRHQRRRVSRELVALAVASLVVVFAVVVLPSVSVDYGLLRAFQQALFVLSPFLALGNVQLLAWLHIRRRAAEVALGVAVVFFLSLTGFIPQVLGGYPAQLHLNNSGQYYDIYYLQAQEVSGIAWLEDRARAEGAGSSIQTEISSDRYTLSRLQNFAEVRTVDDIYPTLVRRSAYVFLGSATVTKSEVTVFYEGDVIAYRYPLAFLDANKDLLYSSGGARIYR